MEFEALKESCLACQKCGLCETRKNVVFGEGVPDAEVMFIGEGPGQNEDEQGKPFVGRSGQLLDQYLHAIHLSREKNIFITNIVKCRPPENRDRCPPNGMPAFRTCASSFALSGPKSSCVWGALRHSG